MSEPLMPRAAYLRQTTVRWRPLLRTSVGLAALVTLIALAVAPSARSWRIALLAILALVGGGICQILILGLYSRAVLTWMYAGAWPFRTVPPIACADGYSIPCAMWSHRYVAFTNGVLYLAPRVAAFVPYSLIVPAQPLVLAAPTAELEEVPYGFRRVPVLALRSQQGDIRVCIPCTENTIERVRSVIGGAAPTE